MDILRALAATYLIATLSATSLAKLRNWRAASVGVLRESVVPRRAVTVTVWFVAVAEFMLAVAIAVRAEPLVTGIVAAGLFVTFGGYRIVVARRTSSLICSCSGTVRSDPASSAAVAGTLAACAAQAAVAGALAVAGGRPDGPLEFVTSGALIVPVILLLAGLLRASGRPQRRAKPTGVRLGVNA